MISLSLEKLQEFLKQNDFEAKQQTETGQIYIILKTDQLEIPLFFRIFEESELLQLLAFIPGKLKTGTEGDTARILHLMNKELDIPGFGMDEAAHAIFYRKMLYAPDKQIDENMISSFIRSIQVICDTFTPIILAVTSGRASYHDILKKLREQEKQNS